MSRPASPSLTAASILESAKAQVRRFGEAKTNMVDIARAMGVSHATLYRFYKSKNAVLDAIVQEAMSDEIDMAKTHINAAGPALERLYGLFIDLHYRKRKRFISDQEIHNLHHRILVERPDMIVDYSRMIAKLVEQLVNQAVSKGEWKINDVPRAARVICDAMTVYIHPTLISQLVTTEMPVENMLRASSETLARAFEAGMEYQAPLNPDESHF